MAALASVWFRSTRVSAAGSQPLSPAMWTCMGGLAIPLWATWPALSLQMREVPPFEGLSLAFTVAWLALLVFQSSRPRRASAPASWLAWTAPLLFALAECGSAAFFLFAQRHIAASEANLIIYLWPGMVVAGGAALGLFHVHFRHLLGIAIGFAGAAILIWAGPLSLSIPGIGLALAGGASWAVYCVFRLKWPAPIDTLLSRGCAFAAIICGALHLGLEHSVVPTLHAAAAAAATGIIPTAIAMMVWDKGIRGGDSRLLAVMAYGTPLCSALLLAALGLEALTWRLAIGAVMIVSAGILSRADPGAA